MQLNQHSLVKTGGALILGWIWGASLYGQAWVQRGAAIDGKAANHGAGYSVSMPDVNTVAIGAVGAGTVAGQVRIFQWDGNAWTQKGNDIDGEIALDLLGASVSMPDANTVAIGAPAHDGNGANAGRVYVFQWNGSAWVQKGANLDGEAAGDNFGQSVSMPDANTLAVGAPKNTGNGYDAGHVRIFKWNGSAWVQKGDDIDGEDNYNWSGWSVSMPDANTVAIGARHNDGNGSRSGHVRIFEWDGGAWVQKGDDIDGEAAGDQSGWSVSMPDINTVAIGAPLNDANGDKAGHVRVYTWDGSDWTQKGNDIDGEAAKDQAGTAVSMPDANTVAIGSPYHDGNGTDAGRVRIFRWNGSTWVQKGSNIDGESAYDIAGYAVSMPDSGTIAMGAFGDDGNGTDAGHVRVFSWGAPAAIGSAFQVPALQIRSNPSDGIYTITLQEKGRLTYIVRDITGKVVQAGIIRTPHLTLDLTNHPNGIYILEVVSEHKGKRAYRLVKR